MLPTSTLSAAVAAALSAKLASRKHAADVARTEAARLVPNDAPRILRLPSVEIKTGLRKTSIYDRMKEGTFPRPVALGNRARGWLASEVDEWIAATATRRA